MHSHHDDHATVHTPAAVYGHYVVIWLALIVLTALTVALAGVGLGRWVILTALTIAATKSTMVLQHFMHLRSEDRIFRIFVLISILTLGIFIVLTFFDYAFR